MKALRVALALAATAALPVQAGTDVGISIGIAQPGVYGRIDIGTAPAPPVLVYPQPVVIAPPPMPRPPVYLYVPPGHAKNWGKHCRRYDACGWPVYFVRNDWYQRHYLPAQGHYGHYGYHGHRGDYGLHGHYAHDGRDGRDGHRGKGKHKDRD